MTSSTSQSPQMQSKFPKRSRDRTLLSCTECHRRKRKCNRNHPCSDCLERRVPHKCHFVVPLQRALGLGHQATNDARDRRILTGEEVLLSLKSVDDLKSARPSYATTHTPTDMSSILFSNHTSTNDIEPPAFFWPFLTSSFVGGFDPFSALPDTTGDPLPKSILIEYFIQRLGPWLGSYDDGQQVGRPALSWLPFALHHPPLFYATLLGSAVHLNRKQPLDKRTLIWYKIETMRLTNETINRPNEGATDQMLIVVLILLYFNVGGGGGEEYEMHLSGINQMLTMRGGMGNLGMRGMVKNWLGICYGPWNYDWHYGLFAEFIGSKRRSPI